MRLAPLVVILALAVTACGGKPPTQPSAPPATPPSTSPAPVVRLQIKVDDGAARDVIASLSGVVVDASGSTGSGPLTFSVDFGDGTVSTSAIARHVYAAPGTFTIVAAVRDAQGREALSATASIEVKAATGSWFHASYVAKTKRVEVRRLTIDAQDGTTVRGSYRVTGDFDRTFTGTLIPPRDIRMNADRGVMLEGTLPARLNDAASIWTLLAHGDSADGQRLDFRAIAGPPDGPPPAASLNISFGDGTPLEPIAGATPVHIDASRSRGSGLSYFLEFGDGFVATAPQAAHVVDAPALPAVTARVTIVDAFGRSDAAATTYNTFDLGITGDLEQGFWTTLPFGAAPYLWISLRQRSGNRFAGFIANTGSGEAAVTGTVTNDGRHIHLSASALGAEWDGSISLPRPSLRNATLTLVQRGGAGHGTTSVVRYFPDF